MGQHSRDAELKEVDGAVDRECAPKAVPKMDVSIVQHRRTEVMLWEIANMDGLISTNVEGDEILAICLPGLGLWSRLKKKHRSQSIGLQQNLSIAFTNSSQCHVT